MTTVFMPPYCKYMAPDFNKQYESPEEYIESLCWLLENAPLDRRFSTFATKRPEWVTHGEQRNFDGQPHVYFTSPLPDNVWHFSGNFFEYSYAFSVYTDDEALVKRLAELIADNLNRPDFLSQAKPKDGNYRSEIQGEVITNWAEILKNQGAAYEQL